MKHIQGQQMPNMPNVKNIITLNPGQQMNPNQQHQLQHQQMPQQPQIRPQQMQQPQQIRPQIQFAQK